MTHAEQIVLVADYLRGKDDIAGWINDVCGIPNVGRTRAETDSDARDYLDTAEAMNFDVIGRLFVSQLIDAYLQKAIEWRDQRRAA